MVKAVSNGSLQAQGTLPKMDCILSASPSADAEKYVVDGITFTNVHQGDQIVIDGITKRVLINGGPAAQRCNIIDFPYLVPVSAVKRIVFRNDPDRFHINPSFFLLRFDEKNAKIDICKTMIP